MKKSHYNTTLVHSQEKHQKKGMKRIVQIVIYALESVKTIGVKRHRSR